MLATSTTYLIQSHARGLTGLLCCFSLILSGQIENRINENLVSRYPWGIHLDSIIHLRQAHTVLGAFTPQDGSFNAVSDTTGQLLFYINHNKVYNRHHQIVHKGDSLSTNYLGNFHSRESAQSLLKANDSTYVIIQYGIPSICCIQNQQFSPIQGYPTIRQLYYSVIRHSLFHDSVFVTSKNNLIPFLGNREIFGGMSCISRYNPKTNNLEVYINDIDSNTIHRVIINPQLNVYLDSSFQFNPPRPISSMQFSDDGRLWAFIGSDDSFQNNGRRGYIYVYSFNWNDNFHLIEVYNQSFISPPSPLSVNVHIDGSFSSSNLFFYFIDAYNIGSNGNVAMLRLNTSVQTHASSIDTLIIWQNSNAFSSIFSGPYGEIFTISSQGPLNPIFGRIPFPDDSSFLFDPNHFSNNVIGAQDYSSYLSEKVPLRMIEFPDFIYSIACQDHPMSFSLDYSKVIDSLHWNFGESSAYSIDSRASNPFHAYTQAGTYSVRMICFFKNFVDTVTHQVTVLPTPKLLLPADSFICPNDSLLLNVSQGFPATYLWSTGSTDSVLYISQPGTYWVTVATDSCGAVSDTIVLGTFTPPAISLQDTVACEEDIIVFSVFADRATYLWNTGDTTASIYAEAQGIYSVTATNPCGESTASAALERQPCNCKLYLPDAFTPNGDGNNDVFTLVSNCADMQWEMVLYNRWGQQVAVLNEQQPQWNGFINGQAAPDGVYSYTLRYHFPESQPIGISFRKVHYGQVVLLR